MIEKLYCFIAYMIPPRLAMWIYIRVATWGSVHDLCDVELPSITIIEALESWKKEHKL